MIMVTSWSSEEKHCSLMRRASSGYWLPATRARALEVAERGAAPESTSPGSRRRSAAGEWWICEMSCTVVTPASSWLSDAEQLVDVDVLRPVHRRELQQDVLEVVDALARGVPSLNSRPSARKLRSAVSNWWWCVSMKPGITIRPRASITPAPRSLQVRPDRDDLLALDQHVGLRRNRRRSGPSTSPGRRG